MAVISAGVQTRREEGLEHANSEREHHGGGDGIVALGRRLRIRALAAARRAIAIGDNGNGCSEQWIVEQLGSGIVCRDRHPGTPEC